MRISLGLVYLLNYLTVAVKGASYVQNVIGKTQENPKLAEGSKHLRIGSGSAVPHSDFPIIVYIMMNYNEEFHYNCVGGLMSVKAVVTACHCVADIEGRRANLRDPATMKVVAGATTLDQEDPPPQVREAKEMMHHPECGQGHGGMINDIGIIIVAEDFELNDEVAIGVVESYDVERAKDLLEQMKSWGETCFTAGWGRTHDSDRGPTNALQLATERLINGSTCANTFCNIGGIMCEEDFAETSCVMADPSFPCKGDSGSPLICRGSIWGVVSFGSHCLPEWPVVFAGVEPLLFMLERHVRNDHPSARLEKFVRSATKPHQTTSYSILIFLPLYLHITPLH